MAILTHRKAWKRQKRERKPKPGDLTEAEQTNAKRALSVFKFRLGRWNIVARAINMNDRRVYRARRRMTLEVAFHMARVIGVPLEDVLQGRWPTPGACPLCGQHVQQPRALPAPRS